VWCSPRGARRGGGGDGELPGMEAETVAGVDEEDVDEPEQNLAAARSSGGRHTLTKARVQAGASGG
jgi:hypothetical protein